MLESEHVANDNIVETLICPICRLPTTICPRAERLSGKMFHVDQKVSDAIKCELLMKYHCDWCPTCRLPLEACREAKVKKAIAKYKTRARKALKKARMEGGAAVVDGRTVVDCYLSPSQVTALADLEKCRKHRPVPNGVLPVWWQP